LLADFNVEGLVFENKAVFPVFFLSLDSIREKKKIFKTQFICNLVILNIQ